MSYQNNGSGAAVLEENNYYPFGLKHEGYNYTPGNPDYRYQYNDKELQDDTGMLDYGWRQYMPELGRWNGMDQLSESYFSYSPYAYVMNNPVMMFDPDGRVSQEWLNGIYNMSRPGKTTYSQFSSNGMSTWANYESLPFGEASRLYSWIDRGGSGYYTYWSGGDSDFTAFFQGGKLNFYGDSGNFNLVRIYNNAPEIRQSYHNFNPYIPDNTLEWYGFGGRANWGFAAFALGLEKLSGETRVTTHGSSLKLYRRNVNGNVFIKNPYTRTMALSKIGSGLGKFSFGLAVAMDVRGTINYYNDPTSPNSVNPGKATVNTAFGALGVWGGVAGGVGSLFYFGIDAFYPGGWDGAMIDTERRQAVFDEIINQNSGMAPQYIFPYGSQKF